MHLSLGASVGSLGFLSLLALRVGLVLVLVAHQANINLSFPIPRWWNRIFGNYGRGDA